PCSNIVLSNNTITGGFNGIRTIQTSASTITGLILQGNHVTGCGDSALVMDSGSVTNALIANNNLRATSSPAIKMTSCIDVRFSNNFVNSTGSVVVSFLGTNTGSSFDKSNFGSGIGAGVNNAGTGLLVEQYGSGAPAAGTWGVGDRIIE